MGSEDRRLKRVKRATACQRYAINILHPISWRERSRLVDFPVLHHGIYKALFGE